MLTFVRPACGWRAPFEGVSVPDSRNAGACDDEISSSMPTKGSSSKSAKPQGPSKEVLELINTYLSRKPDFEKLKEVKDTRRPPSDSREQTEYDRKVKEAVRRLFQERRKEAEASNRTADMPVHPKEEEAPSGLTDYVAKMSKDSDASDHPIHDSGAATMEDHTANPGPAMSESVGQQPKASKEELKKRAEELNKK